MTRRPGSWSRPGTLSSISRCDAAGSTASRSSRCPYMHVRAIWATLRCSPVLVRRVLSARALRRPNRGASALGPNGASWSSASAIRIASCGARSSPLSAASITTSGPSSPPASQIRFVMKARSFATASCSLPVGVWRVRPQAAGCPPPRVAIPSSTAWETLVPRSKPRALRPEPARRITPLASLSGASTMAGHPNSRTSALAARPATPGWLLSSNPTLIGPAP